MFAESTFVVSIPAGFKLDFGFLVFDVVLISKSRFFCMPFSIFVTFAYNVNVGFLGLLSII